MMPDDVDRMIEGLKGNFLLIAGPCLVENYGTTRLVAGELKEMANTLGIDFIFKASYKKANRRSGMSEMGLPDKEGLRILSTIGDELNIPIITDVHTPEECDRVAAFVDALQIPSLLSRQTELIQEAVATELPVNIKKGQFMGVQGINGAIEKVLIERGSSSSIMVTERGNFFGYEDLVIDYRNVQRLKNLSTFPVLVDVCHPLGNPERHEGYSRAHEIPHLAYAALAAGADGLYIETHPNPKNAKSDAETQVPLSWMKNFLTDCVRIHQTYKTLSIHEKDQ